MRISLFGLLGTRADAPAIRGLVYRLRRWPDLPPALRTMEVLRVLTVMGNRPVSRDWLRRHSKLKGGTLTQLLDLLATRGDVDVVDPSLYPAEDA